MNISRRQFITAGIVGVGMWQLNVPFKGNEITDTEIKYRIIPWHSGVWLGPLATSPKSVPNSFAQIYVPFDGDILTPTPDGEYTVINNLNGYLYAKRQPASPASLINDPDVVIPPGGTDKIYAGAARVGLLSTIAGFDNITNRNNNSDFYRGLRGNSAGIYLFDTANKIPPPQSLSGTTEKQQSFDTFDLTVTLPLSATTAMPVGTSPVVVTKPVPQVFQSPPFPTANKATLSVDINVVSGPPAASSQLQITIYRVAPDGTLFPQLVVKNNVDPPCELSISAGQSLTNISSTITTVSGQTQFDLGEAIVFEFDVIGADGTIDFTFDMTLD